MSQVRDERRAGWLLTALSLVGFGLAFGYVEAAVVVYLRTITDPVRAVAREGVTAEELFPVLTLEDLRTRMASGMFLLRVELARELATLAMLACVGLAVGGTPLRRFSAFSAAFGAWDVAYYLWLVVLLDWPASVWTWDVLFLVPTVWTSPVLAPLIVAALMLVCGLHTIALDASGRPPRPGWRDGTAIVAGALMVYTSFVTNSELVLGGDVPSRFEWPLFALGLTLAVVGYLVAVVRGRRRAAVEVAVQSA